MRHCQTEVQVMLQGPEGIRSNEGNARKTSFMRCHVEGSQSFLQGIFCMRKEHEQDTQAGAWPRVLCRWNWDRGNRQAPRKEQAGLKRNVAFTMRKGLNTICSHAMEHDHGCKLILTVSQKNLQRQMGGRRL